MAARESAQKAIDDAETRAKITREEHEKSAKELDEQLATAKVRFRGGVSQVFATVNSRATKI